MYNETAYFQYTQGKGKTNTLMHARFLKSGCFLKSLLKYRLNNAQSLQTEH